MPQGRRRSGARRGGGTSEPVSHAPAIGALSGRLRAGRPLGTFADVRDVATRAANIVKNVEQVPDTPMFRNNTAAFVHELPQTAIADAAGAGDHVRVKVLTNAGALDGDKQLAVVTELTGLVVEASGGRIPEERVWVLLTDATPGGWGLLGHAHTNEEIVEAARAEIGRLQSS